MARLVCVTLLLQLLDAPVMVEGVAQRGGSDGDPKNGDDQCCDGDAYPLTLPHPWR